ncbi:hypothetical protein BJX99DRAFT_15801 [Aspergillus californicus]
MHECWVFADSFDIVLAAPFHSSLSTSKLWSRLEDIPALFATLSYTSTSLISLDFYYLMNRRAFLLRLHVSSPLEQEFASWSRK